MATYTLTTTSAVQDAALEMLRAENGYPTVQALIDAKWGEYVTREVSARDAGLIAAAKAGQALTTAEKDRVKAILGLA